MGVNMELKKWLKVAWWVILVLVITYFVAKRYDSIISGNATTVDIVILLVWISMLLAPLFSEVSIFGVKLKKEIDSLRSDLREQITSLRTEVQNSINVRQEFNPQISLAPPPSDSQLTILSKNFEEIVKETLKAEGIHPSRMLQQRKIEIPDDNMFLISTRYEIEKEVRRIYSGRFPDLRDRTLAVAPRILSFLVESGLLTPRLGQVVREVYSICSVGVHAGKVSSEQMNFVKDLAPGLLASLKAIR